MADKLTSTARQ